MAKKKTAAKKPRKRRRKVNKRAAILDYIADHPEAGPSEVATELGKQRIRVTAAYVSNVKSTGSNGKAKRRGPGRKQAELNGTPSEDMKQAGELMLQAVDLVVRAGVREAKALVEMAGKVVDRIAQKA